MTAWLTIGSGWLICLLGAYLLGFGISLPKLKRQSVIHTASDMLLVSSGYGIFLLLLQRPLFAIGVSFVILIVLIVVNNAKVTALQEPLAFSDFGLFSQVFKYPRLYLPFLHVPLVVVLVVLGLVAIISIWLLEPAMSSYTKNGYVLNGGVTLCFLSVLCIFMYRTKRVVLQANIVSDIKNHGFLTSLLLGYQHALADIKCATYLKQMSDCSHLNHSVAMETSRLPHIFTIQSESFFDARRLSSLIKADVLGRFDQIVRESQYAGQVEVAAWGANTMRSEFSFLTGIPNENLGLHQYNPYQYLPIAQLPSLLKKLKLLGYRCIALHPYPAGFFQRDRVFKAFGFDEFLDLAAFVDSPKSGPYTSDLVVADKMLSILDAHQQQYPDQPLFLFTITMENHGPLHLESVSMNEVQQLFAQPVCEQVDDLAVYLRHLKNADAMFAKLISTLKQQEMPTVVCCYGDHVPSMPAVYQALNYQNANTDYFIWHSKKYSATPVCQNVNIAALSTLLLDVVLSQPLMKNDDYS